MNADDVDVLLVEQGGLNQYNLYVYCLNNSVNRIDESGNLSLPNSAKITIGVVTTIAAIGITVSTGGAALPILASVAASTVSGAAIGYMVDGKQGALDGASDGLMWGGIGSLATSVVGAVKTVREYKKNIDTYSSLRKQYKGTGKEVHHIIEQRLVKGSSWKVRKMPSISLDKTVHRSYTNAWRQQIKYGTRYRSGWRYKYQLYKATNKVYKHSRVLRMASRYTILKMRGI